MSEGYQHDSHRGEIFKLCAHNPNGADEEMCKRLSGISAHAVRCEESKCTCKWRIDIKSVGPHGGQSSTGDALKQMRMRMRVLRKAHLPSDDHPAKKLPPRRSRQVRKESSVDEQRSKLLNATTNTAEDNSHPAGAQVLQDTLTTGPRLVTSTEGIKILKRVRHAMSTAVLVVVDPKKIRPLPGQPRVYFNDERMAALAASIKNVGQVTPGLLRRVENDKEGRTHELLDGERRWRACLSLGIQYRAMQVDVDDGAAPYVTSVIANFNREGHTPMEISDAIMQMNEGLKMTQKEISNVIGLSLPYVSRLYSLQRLVPEVRDMLDPSLAEGKLLTVTAAIQIAMLRPQAQVARAQKWLRGEMTMVDLRLHARHSEDRAVPAPPKPDMFEQWRRIQRRADAVRRVMNELRSVIKTTEPPSAIGQIHPKVMSKGSLRHIRDTADECLKILEATDPKDHEP